MSLNPIQEMGESPHSTPAYNSLSTSSTSSTSSLSHHHQAPISTSLPSFSSSASTYTAPIIQAGGTITTITPMSTDTNGPWSSQASQQQRQMPQTPQLFSNYRSQPSFSNRSGFSVLTSSSSSAASSILNVTASPSSLAPVMPPMERSNSASTMYSVSSSGGHFHEKSNSTGSISVNLKDSANTNHLHYIPSHRSPVYDHMPSITKELEKLEQSGQDDKWASLSAKVLPLFNGLGLKAYIEDLNELVRCCIKDRSPQLLRDDINNLLLTGMSTLNGKLKDVPDEKLVSRLVEIWAFYFGTVLPYFEGVFLPLQMQATAQRDDMNVRRLVLMSFRDHVILPIGKRVEDAFNKLFHDFDSGIPVTDTAARMLQMSYILSSILSDDEKQKDMDRILGKLKNNWKLFMRRRDRRGFVGMSPSNTSNVQTARESKVGNIASNTANSTDGMPIIFSPAS